MRRSISVLLAILACAVFSEYANAQITDFHSTTNTECLGDLPGFVTNDLFIGFDGQYTGSQLLVELTSGSVYQDGLGSNAPPDQAFVDSFPLLPCDTFLALGSARSGGPFGDPPSGGAVPVTVDLGGGLVSQFDQAGINAAWGPNPGLPILNQAAFLNARVTLSDDATGTGAFLASADGEISLFSFQVKNGVILIPEPSALLLLAIGSFGLLYRTGRHC